MGDDSFCRHSRKFNLSSLGSILVFVLPMRKSETCLWQEGLSLCFETSRIARDFLHVVGSPMVGVRKGLFRSKMAVCDIFDACILAMTARKYKGK